MPSTKNATNRIRKGRREGRPATGGSTPAARRGVAGLKSTSGESDLPREQRANGSRRASGLVSKRKAKRKPAATARRGEGTAPRTSTARRKRAPAAGKAVKRRGLTAR